MSQRKRIEGALRAEQMFRSLQEAAPDAIVSDNQAEQTVLVNCQTQKLFGYMRIDMLGQTV